MRRAVYTLVMMSGLSAAATGQQPAPSYPGTSPGAQPGTYPTQPGSPVGPYDQFGPYGQYGSFPPQGGYMPNIYNPSSQPLSPYLNTVRGTNPAVDYYFLTRPGTTGMGGRSMSGAPFTSMGAMRPSYFPQLMYGPDPFQQGGPTSPGSVLPPAGHQVVFNNTLGYFPSAFGQAGAGGGLAGVGGMQQPKK